MKTKSILVVVMMVTTVLVCVTGAKANIVNPSFENGSAGWTRTNIWDPAMGSQTKDYFATDGTYSLQIYSGGDMSNTIGNNRGAYQNVSLTDIDQILFDVKLSSHYYGAPCVFRDYAAMFLIDGIPYWTQTVEGTYLNQIVDVSALFGLHQIELRLECINDENYSPSCWSEWDNLRAISKPSTPPIADADGPYTITAGDTLTLDASGSVDEDNDIVSYMWDLDDDGDFETDANNQAIFDVNYTYLLSLDLNKPNVYDIHLLVTDSEEQSDTADSTLTIFPKPVIVDIRPASCFNPLNLRSNGILPVAVLGTEDFDVNDIDIASVRLAGVAPFRSSYHDITGPPSEEPNACGCATTCPDGYTDLMLKFRTPELAEALTDIYEDIVRGDELELTLTGALYDGTPIEGLDYITVVGKMPNRLNNPDINKMKR